MGEAETGDYEFGPIYSGSVSVLYSPLADDIVESIDYPNQMWHEDDEGRYRLFILSIQPAITYVKYYLIGTL